MNIEETAELLELISESYPSRFRVTENTIKVWQDMLKDQDFGGVMYRARKHIERLPQPPTISDLKIQRYPVIG